MPARAKTASTDISAQYADLPTAKAATYHKSDATLHLIYSESKYRQAAQEAEKAGDESAAKLFWQWSFDVKRVREELSKI